MNKIIHGLLVAVFAVGLVTGCASRGGGQRVTDPNGRFSFQAPPELASLAGDETLYHYQLQGQGLDAFVAVQPARIEEEGIEQTLRRVGVDPSVLVMDGSASFGDWQARRMTGNGKDITVAVAYQMRGDTVYSLVVTGTSKSMPGDPPPPVMHLLGSFKFNEAAGRIAVPATRADLEALVRRSAETRGGSISLAAIRDGAIIYRYSFGTSRLNEEMTPGTAYHWGSMTKLVTATAVMQLAQRGLVDVSAPVSTYLPLFPKGLGIRVIDLLTHSSGLPDREANHLVAYANHRLPPMEEILADYLAHVDRLDFTPGTQAEYCNWNYLALGVLIERVTGRPFASYVTESVLGPSGMEHTAFNRSDLPSGTPLATPIIRTQAESAMLVDLVKNLSVREREGMITARSGDLTYLADFDILAPWGGLVGPADDAARFLWTSIDSAAANAQWGLSRATLESMQRMQKSTNGRPLGRGIGWALVQEKGETILEHGGGGPGIETLMRMYPKRRLGVVVMGNINNYGASRIISAAADILTREGR